MKLNRRIRKLIEKHNIELHITPSAADMKDADIGDDPPEELLGLFICDPNEIRRGKKKIWLKQNNPTINDVALHELGHYFTLREYWNKSLTKMDEESAYYVEELLAEGAAIAMAQLLRIKVKRQTIELLRDIAKKLIVRST